MTTVVDPDPSRTPAVAVGSTGGPARGASVVKPSTFAPSVRFHAASDATDLGTTLRDALSLLVDSGNLRWAESGAHADVLHTVGDVSDAYGTANHRMHTVDRIPVRHGRKLAASRLWTVRQRRAHHDGTVWLTHGRRSGRLIVDAGLAPGERVRCLPMLPSGVPASSPGRADVPTSRQREAARRALGVRPGAQLVVGLAGPQPPREVDGWPAAVRVLQRPDVLVLRPEMGSERLPLPVLLAAADLFVATDHALTAFSPAVTALAIGVPVIAVTTDAAAELVDAGRTGLVVSPRLEAVVDAVIAHLDSVPSPRRHSSVRAMPPVQRELASSLLRAYGEALAAPAVPRWFR